MTSRYVCRDVIENFVAKGFYTAGALKTNRVVYPGGMKINVADHARLLSDEHGKLLFDLVTVKSRNTMFIAMRAGLTASKTAWFC